MITIFDTRGAYTLNPGLSQEGNPLNSDPADLTIGAVAARLGMRASAIRYYERVGLLPAPRRSGGQRRYEAGAVQTLAVIQLAQQAGFTLAEITHLLHGFGSATPPSERWQALALEKIRELDQRMEQLRAMRRMLEQTLGCSCPTIGDCAGDGASLCSPQLLSADAPAGCAGEHCHAGGDFAEES
jgi:MerR family transcriptional regulator, redox-sensitive transcriptional activator SoxR